MDNSKGLSPLIKTSDIIDKIKHYLPCQAVLKDFVHHNTLHAFQNLNFHEGITKSKKIFGHKVYMQLDEYRQMYFENKISKKILQSEIKSLNLPDRFLDKVLYTNFNTNIPKLIGNLRSNWKAKYSADLDLQIHPLLFRYICNFLDQGISTIGFPYPKLCFFEAMKRIDTDSFNSIFLKKKGRARSLFYSEDLTIDKLLDLLLADSHLKENYLFDQQFSHPGWSGLVSMIEAQPDMLIEKRLISLEHVIKLELLLEIDFLDSYVGQDKWSPIKNEDARYSTNLFEKQETSDLDLVLKVFQNSFEKTYYEIVLQSLKLNLTKDTDEILTAEFQALFCIDDREASLRRHLESIEPKFSTYATPGFFGFDFFFQPANSNNMTKQCPGPMNPKHIIQEVDSTAKKATDYYLKQNYHSFFKSWALTQSLGYWSAFKLFFNIFKPSISPATTSSMNHMDKVAKLTVAYDENKSANNNFKVGFSDVEMAERIYNLLVSIDLTSNFSKTIYIIGHGASSINNPHFSAYDCGACSGRPGSVNARVFAHAANLPEVRLILQSKGLHIPESTVFIGAIHDTTRDDIDFFDVKELNDSQREHYRRAKKIFNKALCLNAKERSRRFLMVNTKKKAKVLRDYARVRSMSLFEPRPELNHATNSLCIVGPRQLTKGLFLDRRAFLNSYNPLVDPKGLVLEKILNAATPVCGGINLEYYFSKVDNQKLGAGTKLPHNVMGLLGVANGVDGDLRPGLPIQMIEVHDPIRLLMIVYQDPDIVLETIKRVPLTYEWFKNEWVHLACISPSNNQTFIFKDKKMNVFAPQEHFQISNIGLKEIALSREALPPSIYKIRNS